jgi:GAF domain-containing protein
VSDGAMAMDAAFAALSEFFIDDGTLGDTLLRVAELACEVSAADMAGITMLVGGRPRTGVFTDPEAPDIDNAQYESGSGPCLDAFRDQRIYRIDSISREQRWPEFTREAAGHGIVATLSLPVIARGQSLGALNLYSRTAPFGDASRLEIFARHAAIVLANAQLYWDARQLTENMQQAMRSRSAIDQAMGILMADGGRSPHEAFQLLIRASQRENRKLRDIASGVVARTAERAGVGPLRPGSGSGGPDSGH